MWFSESAIVRLPCIVAVADEKKQLVFLKAQAAGVRGESGGERGEEAVRAATQLSNIGNQTQRGGTSDTHERRQERRVITSPCLFWICSRS